MRKTVSVFAAMAMIIALIGLWVRFASVATQTVTAAGAKPPTGAISPFELMSRNRQALPNQYYRDPF
jgi:hypothetical protein